MKQQENQEIRWSRMGSRYLSYTRRARRSIFPKLKMVSNGKSPLEERACSLSQRDLHHLRSGLVVRYRPFSQTDAPRVSRIFIENIAYLKKQLSEETYAYEIGSRYSVEGVSRQASARDFYVVTTPDGIVLGVTSVVCYSIAHAEVMNLSVDKDFRGKGLGKLLAGLTALRMMEQGISKVYAFAAPKSQRIFLQLGFIETSPVARLLFHGTVLSLSAKLSDSIRQKTRQMLDGILV